VRLRTARPLGARLLSHAETPPWCEQVPQWLRLKLWIPSRQCPEARGNRSAHASAFEFDVRSAAAPAKMLADDRG
ncbi:MAG: hypothetical protein JWP15_1216, partial [Alphaproteobacteria bacterium]|nr:hypothetical protein [Alphaproteobacteria bacterium]